MINWKDVIGYEGIYQVSEMGQVKRILRSKGAKGGILKPIYQHGYPTVGLRKDGKTTRHYVHRLVAFAFLGKPPCEGAEVNHKDGNRADSSLYNLEWCDRSYNARDAKRREWQGVKPGKPGDGIKMFDKHGRA